MVDEKDGYLNLIYPEEYSNAVTDEVYIISGAYVNGEPLFVNTSSSSPRSIGNGLISDMRSYSVTKEFPTNEEFDLIIEFENFDDQNDKAAVKTRVSMADLTKDSKIYSVDYEIPESGGIKIRMMKINLISPKIEMSEPVPNKNYSVTYNEYTEIIGTNEKGKVIAFTLDSGTTVGESSETKSFETVYRFVPKDEINHHGTISDYSIEELNNLEDKFEFQIYRNLFDKEPITEKWIFNKVEVLGEPFTVDFN